MSFDSYLLGGIEAAPGSEPGIKTIYALGLCAELAYSEPKPAEAKLRSWGFTHVLHFDVAGTEAFIAGFKGAIVVSFRGTEPDEAADIAADLDIRLAGAPLAGKAHKGFRGALGRVWDRSPLRTGSMEEALYDLTKELYDRKTGKAPAVYLTGHSLGAALATLASAEILADDNRVAGLVTFGSPRVGDEDFVNALNRKIEGRAWRVVNNNDLVTDAPLRRWGFRHCGRFIYISEGGSITEDPTGWWHLLDRGWGAALDLLEKGIDGLKDHSIRNEKDGYLPALEQNQLDRPAWA